MSFGWSDGRSWVDGHHLALETGLPTVQVRREAKESKAAALFVSVGTANCTTTHKHAGLLPTGRLSFHPIPCGSRDRPVGRKVIDVDIALAKGRRCVFPLTGKIAL